MTTPKHREDFYCRHQGESNQREESRLNMADRLNQTMRGSMGESEQERQSAERPGWSRWQSYIGTRLG